MNSKQVKMGSATVGAGALLAMGAFGVATSFTSVAQEPEPAPPGPVTRRDHDGRNRHRNDGADGPETSAAVPPITTPASEIMNPEE